MDPFGPPMGTSKWELSDLRWDLQMGPFGPPNGPFRTLQMDPGDAPEWRPLRGTRCQGGPYSSLPGVHTLTTMEIRPLFEREVAFCGRACPGWLGQMGLPAYFGKAFSRVIDRRLNTDISGQIPLENKGILAKMLKNWSYGEGVKTVVFQRCPIGVSIWGSHVLQ